jgi:histidine triad (HIT) family protein
MEQKCVFCAIASKQIPANVVYEDENSIAILDINPRSTGMTLIIPKIHLKTFYQNSTVSKRVYSSALKVSKMIKKALKPKAISVSILPSELEHFHIRIYPVYENEVPVIENQPKKVSEEDLNAITEKIKLVSLKKKVMEKPKEKEKSKEDKYWVKRAMQLT